MSGFSPSSVLAAERREQYYQLRRDGTGMWDAATELDLAEPTLIKRYERWFQAVERGETPVPGRRGARRGPA